jgi:putative NADH-flavin reductase
LVDESSYDLRGGDMNITVFGATGGIGGEVVRQALANGSTVVAVVRDPARFTLRHPALRVVAVTDLTDVDVLLPALDGAGAAISGIGPRGPRQVTVASSTGAAILRALEKSGVRRFVAVTAAPVAPAPPGDSLGNRILFPVIGRLLHGIYADLARLEDEMRRSDTDWTIVRPPNLTNRPLTGTYRTALDANVPRGRSIGRADVAHCMLSMLADPTTIHRAVGVAT